MRRSRLLPGRGARSGRLGSITGPGMIDVDARHRERKIGIIIASARPTSSPARTQSDGPGQLSRPLGDVRPVPKRHAVSAPGAAPIDARKCVQACRIDELQAGQIDDETHHADRLRIKLAINQRTGRAVKHTGQPHDPHQIPTLPTNRKRPFHNRLISSGNRVLGARPVPRRQAANRPDQMTATNETERLDCPAPRDVVPLRLSMRPALRAHGSSLQTINKTVTRGWGNAAAQPDADRHQSTPSRPDLARKNSSRHPPPTQPGTLARPARTSSRRRQRAGG